MFLTRCASRTLVLCLAGMVAALGRSCSIADGHIMNSRSNAAPPITIMLFSDPGCGWSRRQVNEIRGSSKLHKTLKAFDFHEVESDRQVVLPDGSSYCATSWPHILVFDEKRQFAGSVLGYRHPDLLEFELLLITSGVGSVQSLERRLARCPSDGFAWWRLAQHLKPFPARRQQHLLSIDRLASAESKVGLRLAALYKEYDVNWPCLHYLEGEESDDVRFVVYWNYANYLRYHARDAELAKQYYRQAKTHARLEYQAFLESRVSE